MATLLISDRESALMTDQLLRVSSLAPLAVERSSRRSSDHRLPRTCPVRTLDAVIPVHTHTDHALDSAVVAARAEPTLVGVDQPRRRSRASPAEHVVVEKPGAAMTFSTFRVTLIESRRSSPDRSSE